LNIIGKTLLSTTTEYFLAKQFSQDLHKQSLPPSKTKKFDRMWKHASHHLKLLRDRVWPYMDYLVERALKSGNTTRAAIRERAVSGGIFLNSRFANILLALTEMLLQEDGIETSEVKVCETGFGAGHGVALYWAAASGLIEESISLKVVSFDFYIRVYQPSTLNWLRMELYNTSSRELISVKGDTCWTVPKFFTSQAACGLVHGSSLCPSDDIDIVLFAAACGTILTSTAMDSLESEYVYYFKNFTAEEDPLTFLPNKYGQWSWLSRNGCIAEVTCYNEEAFALQRDLFFSNSGTSHNQKFCIGLVTGECEGPDNFLLSADPEKWGKGYGRSITRNLKAREKCTNSTKYIKRSSLLSAVAEHYKSFLITNAEIK